MQESRKQEAGEPKRAREAKSRKPGAQRTKRLRNPRFQNNKTERDPWAATNQSAVMNPEQPPGSPQKERIMKALECNTCGYIYDEREGLPDEGFPPGTKWEDIPDDWVCPECGATKADFTPLEFD